MAKMPNNGVFTNEVLQPKQALVLDTPVVEAPVMSGASSLVSTEEQAHRDEVWNSATVPDEATVSASTAFKTGASTGLLATGFRWLLDDTYEAVAGYKPNLASLPGYAAAPANEHEARILHESRSPAELSASWDRILSERNDAATAAARLGWALAGALSGDLPLIALTLGAGAGTTAVTASARAGLIAEAAVGVGEAAIANKMRSYSSHITGVDVVAPILGAVAGGLIGLKVIRRADGTADVVSSEAAISTRQTNDVIGTGKAAVEVEVRPGEVTTFQVQAGTLRQIAKAEGAGAEQVNKLLDEFSFGDDLKINLRADPNIAPVYRSSDHSITIGVGEVLAKSTVDSFESAAKLLTKAQLQSLRHELFHAATVSKLNALDPAMAKAVTKLRRELQFHLGRDSTFANYLNANAEMLAGLADPKFAKAIDALELPEQLFADVAAATGAKGSTAKLASIFKESTEAISAPKPEKFTSDTFNDINAGARGDADSMRKSLLERLTDAIGYTRHLSLYDRVADTGRKVTAGAPKPSGLAKSLADTLFADGSAVGPRSVDAAADNVRLLQVKAAPYLKAVQDSMLVLLQKRGVKRAEIIGNTERAVGAQERLGREITDLMQANYSRTLRGEPALEVPLDLQPMVEALQKHYAMWAKEVQDLPDMAARINENPWYLPRQYNYSRIRQFMETNTLDESHIKTMFKNAYLGIKNADGTAKYSDALATSKAQKVVEGIFANGAGSRTASWRYVLDENLDDLLVSEANYGRSVMVRLDGAKEAVGAAGTYGARHAQARTNFNPEQILLQRDSDVFTLTDLMQTDVLGSATQYTNTMAGRSSLVRAGFKDPNELDKAIEAAAADIPVKDVRAWRGAVDNGVEQLLGMAEPTPQFMRILSNMATSVMLKNSGLYQIVDTATALAERGLPAWIRGLSKSGTMDALQSLSKEEAGYLQELLNGSVVARNSTYRWFQDRSMATASYTKIDAAEGISANAAQFTMKLNGLHSVARAQASVHSNVIIATADAALSGDKGALKIMQETGGLSADDIKAWKKAGSTIEDTKLRRRVENALMRMQDNYTMQHRVGEIPAWATATAAGRVLTGFGKFTLAATNKMMRRTANRGLGPFVTLAMYQTPLMLVAQAVRAKLEGKNLSDEKAQAELFKRSVLNLSILGSVGMLADPLSGQGRISNPGLSWPTQVVGSLAGAASGEPADIYKAASQFLGPLGMPSIKGAVIATGLLDEEE